jgi:ubiquinone/menaquinone biosynthesis C-methylase UbiE
VSITHPGKGQIVFVRFASRLARRFIYPDFIDSIGLRGDERVLDFGSGWGDNTFYIARKLDKGGRVTALDVSSEWQAVIKKRMRDLRNVDYVNADVRDSGLPDGSFDVIVIRYVLHDIPREERTAIVTALARKLRPGGFIQLREPTKPRHGMPVAEIRSLMSGNGLKESSSTAKKSEFSARYLKG